jgi:hypothetical protein
MQTRLLQSFMAVAPSLLIIVFILLGQPFSRLAAEHNLFVPVET